MRDPFGEIPPLRQEIDSIFFFDELGKRHKVSTRCKLKSHALRFLKQFRQSDRERRIKLQRVSLTRFSEDYLNYSRTVLASKSQESARTSFRELVRIVGDIPLHKVGVREIENFLAVKVSEASDRTARTYCITSNTFRQVEKPRLRELHPEHFTKVEFQAMMRVVDQDDLRQLFFFALTTGLRLSEITALQWTDVDLARKVIHVSNSDTFTTKSKKNRVVPMSEQVWQMLVRRTTSRRASSDTSVVQV